MSREVPPGYIRVAFEADIPIGVAMTFVITPKAQPQSDQLLPPTPAEPPGEIGQ